MKGDEAKRLAQGGLSGLLGTSFLGGVESPLQAEALDLSGVHPLREVECE